jgi:hypothetical protein
MQAPSVGPGTLDVVLSQPPIKLEADREREQRLLRTVSEPPVPQC